MLVDAAYETKRMRSMLAENMAARMSLESQRREEIIVYNRELREKSTAQKAKVPRRAGGGGGGSWRVFRTEKSPTNTDLIARSWSVWTLGPSRSQQPKGFSFRQFSSCHLAFTRFQWEEKQARLLHGECWRVRSNPTLAQRSACFPLPNRTSSVPT